MNNVDSLLSIDIHDLENDAYEYASISPSLIRGPPLSDSDSDSDSHHEDALDKFFRLVLRICISRKK